MLKKELKSGKIFDFTQEKWKLFVRQFEKFEKRNPRLKTKNLFIDYGIYKKCDNDYTLGMKCVKCENCGRKFKNGLCINIDKFPPYEQEG